MNKKKIAALALSGTLLMGGAGFGAYSWFTDSATVDPNLSISTATLKVAAIDSNDWKVMGDKSQAHIDTGVVTNAQPGDNYYKLVKITNNGSVDQVLNFKPNTELQEQYNGAINVGVGEDTTGTAIHELQNVKLAPQKSITVRVVVGLDGEKMGNEYNGMKDPIHLNKILNGKLLTVEATQTNAPSVPEPHAAK